jgi:hypothetical protein
MARKTLTVIIDKAGRDQGKTFLLEEMPAAQAERWAMRAFLALARSGVDIPEDIASAGLAGIATLGIKALGGLSFGDAEPLLNEMMGCVRLIPDPSRPGVMLSYPQFEGQIEEPVTFLTLRMEVFKLHTDFFSIAGRLTSARQTSQPE